MTTPHPLRRHHRHRRRRPQGAAAAVLTALVALATGACGIGADAAPHVIAKKDVPYGLLAQSPTTTVPALLSQYVTIYLDGPLRLVAVSRSVPAPVSLRSALTALGQGPTSQEAADGLESPISTAAPLTVSRRSETGPIVTVSVSGSFTSLAGQDQAIAMAQLVYTATAFPGVTGVDVRINGRPAKVPTAKGTLVSGPIDRADYPDLAPL